MFEIRPEAQNVQDAVASFFNEKILPQHGVWQAQSKDQEQPDIEKALRAEAKSLNLWNLALAAPGRRRTGHSVE